MKKAFTMLELVFVIVVIGILAASIIPTVQGNPVREAAVKLVSQIRYAQHLAMVDDKYTTSGAWYKNRWQIEFTGNKYSIVSDNNTTFAKDPQNSGNDIKNIELKGLNPLVMTGTECAGKTIISFDNLGRPMVGSLSATTSAYTASGNNGELIKTDDCAIVLTDGSKTVYIDIRPETGYSSIR